ncbi:dipicolinate synthase subunit DpsA [Alicyclobacillus shizuokensis]|uniref:dipicolinate synthase subunit DpsA n=1 Tax=Alicyclobacillus shizuokensis TaxID=392014 RepID=UPI00083171A2|nr:dipicolinate synthase subunit DpsA [Alicyclobacillus shizuokensis]
MLTGRQVLFIGGDARMVEVIAQVIESDGSVALIGFDQLSKSFPDTRHVPLSEPVFSQVDGIVLPVAGMEDDGRVDSHFAEAPIYLREDLFRAAKPGTFVFSGIARPVLEQWCQSAGLRLVKLMELDEVAILNSIPTAEGAIALAMQHTDITLHGARVLVVGFGRCGQTLARTAAALGAKVRVAARDTADLARIIEMGLEPVAMDGLEAAVRDIDVVFNTVPAPILTAEVLKVMPRETVIIDIASKPGGTDFRYAERRGMKAILTPSLPGLVAPKTAGRIIAATVCRLLAADGGGITGGAEG